MDGVLLIDKPAGITSHDVVAWARRTLGQRTIGHTGTLDPMATGLLALVVGKATRLSSLLTGKDKTYDAQIRLGFSTDTDDATGEPLGPSSPGLPDDSQIQKRLDAFIGLFLQRPPSHSAKKIAGRPAYSLARRNEPVDLPPVEVALRSIDWRGRAGDRVSLHLTVSAGFYVRALARDLGEQLGCGGHLSALRRLGSGSFRIEQALTLEAAEALGPALARRLIEPAAAIADLTAVTVSEAGLLRIRHGNAVGPAQLVGRMAAPAGSAVGNAPVRLLDGSGRLVALGVWRVGALHPVVVLG